MAFEDIAEIVAVMLEAGGVLVLLVGLLGALARYLFRREDLQGRDVYQYFRRSIGRSVLLGLELLVAADIVHTVATQPTFESLGLLGLLILIRTFLSIEIDMELEGRWPWQGRASAEVEAVTGQPESPDA